MGKAQGYKYRVIFGKWLRRRREELKLHQKDVVLSLGLKNPNVVSFIEAGILGIPAERVERYADALLLDKKDFIRWWLIIKAADEGIGGNRVIDLLSDQMGMGGGRRDGKGEGRGHGATLPAEWLAKDITQAVRGGE